MYRWPKATLSKSARAKKAELEDVPQRFSTLANLSSVFTQCVTLDLSHHSAGLLKAATQLDGPLSADQGWPDRHTLCQPWGNCSEYGGGASASATHTKPTLL